MLATFDLFNLIYIPPSPTSGLSNMAGPSCAVKKSSKACRRRGPSLSLVHFSLHYFLFSCSWQLPCPYLPLSPCFLFSVPPTNLFICPPLQLYILFISFYILPFSKVGTQSNMHHSSLSHFILTITLWGELGWKLVTGPRLPSEHHGRMEIWTWVSPDSRLKLTTTPLAFVGWLMLVSNKQLGLGESCK